MKRFDLKVIVLTVVVTIGVIALWEVALRPFYFSLVDVWFPGDAYAETRWNVKQRFEHFFISFTVDVLVVTMLLRLVHRQQRQLKTSEERYRALFEQAKDGIALVHLPDYRMVEVNKQACQLLGVRQQDCIDRDIRELLRTSSPNAQTELMMTSNGHSAGETELLIKTPENQTLPISVA